MKKTTIHKKNEIVRGTDDYSVMAKRALNAIYWVLQKHELYKHTHIQIKFSTLRKMMNLESDQRYVETMKRALVELQQPMELNNFTHPQTEMLWQWYSCSVLDEAGFMKDNHKWIVTIKVGSIMKYVMQVKGGFTPMDIITHANKFRTKYAMKLYEYLRSFAAMKYIDITQSHMMKLLALEESQTYEYYSPLLRLVERQIKEIIAKSDLKEVKLMKSKSLSKDRVFRIIINPKSKKMIDKIEAKTALESLIKRF